MNSTNAAFHLLWIPLLPASITIGLDNKIFNHVFFCFDIWKPHSNNLLHIYTPPINTEIGTTQIRSLHWQHPMRYSFISWLSKIGKRFIYYDWYIWYFQVWPTFRIYETLETRIIVKNRWKKLAQRRKWFLSNFYIFRFDNGLYLLKIMDRFEFITNFTLKNFIYLDGWKRAQ